MRLGERHLSPDQRVRRAADERAIGRLMVSVTYAAVAFLVIGVATMAAAGVSPLDPPPPFAPESLVADLLALRPEAWLWLGLFAVIATPIARVVAAAASYLRNGERRMLLISIAILVVIAIGVVSATLTDV